MKLKSGIIILLFLSLLKCSSVNKITTDIVPVETLQAQIIDNNCALIISNNIMLAAKEIKEEHLQKILNNDNFIDKKISPESSRMPKLIYFKLALENTGNIPLNLGEIKLHYNNISINPMNADDLRNKYNSLPYAGLKFGDILSLYKSDTGELCDNDMDFSGDFVKHKGSILSGDKVFQIIAFNWIPVEIRKFNLSIVIKSDIIKKIIDFKLMRFEYRQSGKYYIKPVKNDISF